jgi:hypothetical protein
VISTYLNERKRKTIQMVILGPKLTLKPHLFSGRRKRENYGLKRGGGCLLCYVNGVVREVLETLFHPIRSISMLEIEY